MEDSVKGVELVPLKALWECQWARHYNHLINFIIISLQKMYGISYFNKVQIRNLKRHDCQSTQTRYISNFPWNMTAPF